MSLSPEARRRAQQLARWARKAPGYRLVLDEVLPRVRRSAVLTDLVWRVFAPRHGIGHVDVALLPDRHVHGPDVNRLPVVGVLGTGMTSEQASSLVEQVAQVQRETRSFRPVLVLDQPVFADARRHGYVVEHVVPRVAWVSGDWGEVAWEDYVARRVGAMMEHYQLWHLARVAAGPDGVPRLDPVDMALLRRLPDLLPDDLDVEV